MKTITLFYLAIFAFLAVQLSCKHEAEPPIIISDCQLERSDSLTLENGLIGRWKWEYIECFGHPDDANGTEYLGVEIEFKTDHTLEVKENGILVQTSDWSLTRSFIGSYFYLNADPIENNYLAGIIHYCPERVLFQESPVDGCDNFFRRIK